MAIGRRRGVRQRAMGIVLGVLGGGHADAHVRGAAGAPARVAVVHQALLVDPSGPRRRYLGRAMTTARARILALDLEGTLISSAVSQIPRPGLLGFLSWALDSFERVVIFSAVRTELAEQIMRTLAALGDAPAEAATIPCVAWTGAVKDLAFVDDTCVGEVLLVDDQERYVVPSQREQWIPIAEWEYPYDDADRELERVRGVLAGRLEAKA